MKVRLDLHTHIWEVFNFQPPSVSIAEKVVAQIKARGIDGIGITDHNNKEWAFEFREVVEHYFPGKATIIPGWRSRFGRRAIPSTNTRLGSSSCPKE